MSVLVSVASGGIASPDTPAPVSSNVSGTWRRLWPRLPGLNSVWFLGPVLDTLSVVNVAATNPWPLLCKGPM